MNGFTLRVKPCNRGPALSVGVFNSPAVQKCPEGGHGCSRNIDLTKHRTVKK